MKVVMVPREPGSAAVSRRSRGCLTRDEDGLSIGDVGPLSKHPHVHEDVELKVLPPPVGRTRIPTAFPEDVPRYQLQRASMACLWCDAGSWYAGCFRAAISGYSQHVFAGMSLSDVMAMSDVFAVHA